MNYFNLYILVFCRHNHDLKCILSGKSAKAAMFYITDYITKMSLNTYETLSLLSRAVAQAPDNDKMSAPLGAARTLLHKCLTQFTRQQQIHAQQAARYIRGFSDSVSSHKTIPMMSGLMISFVSSHYQLNGTQSHAGAAEQDESDAEFVPMKIVTDGKGQLVDTTQVHHYWFRAESLRDMTFYDFCRFVRIEKKSRSEKVKNTHESRLGVLRRHELRPEHPLCATHHLVEHTNLTSGDGTNSSELVPRVIGSSIPRNTSPAWCLFALTHFKPFGVADPLIVGGATAEKTFEEYDFTPSAVRIMNNWDAVHECEDERDADRLKKQAARTKQSQFATQVLAPCNEAADDEAGEFSVDKCVAPEQEFRMWQSIITLQVANWFASPSHVDSVTGNQENAEIELGLDNTNDIRITLTPTVVKTWKKAIKDQEKNLTDQRRNSLNPEAQNAFVSDSFDQGETQTQGEQISAKDDKHLDKGEAIAPDKETLVVTSQSDLLSVVEQKFSLNERQSRAFRIISNHYVMRYVEKNVSEKPLRMLMTGPGGTGKTHVVKALKCVMIHYGCGHRIRFLAPTGSAASNIDGMTIHKGLGLKIVKKDRGKGTRDIGASSEDFTLLVSIQNKTQLRDEWRNVDVVLIDEISLTSAQLLCEIDQALRFAKENQDDWFGGITVVFAGDFYQFPPVSGTPLYTPIPVNGKQTNDELLRRLGHLAWKSVNIVVELTEQQRMKADKEYSEAVQRLRVRQCEASDVDLFNSRLIKGPENPNGVDMGVMENSRASAIVGTNQLREALNLRKARSTGGADLVICASRDIFPSVFEVSKAEYETLLTQKFSSSRHHGALPGFLPLYESMPVILQLRNISTELKITNGSQGIIKKLFTGIDEWGFTYCECAIVEFEDSPIQLDGLPRGYFPIFPVTFSYPTKLKLASTGKEEIIRVSRNQLPLQPGFAVTGHSAQGKTLPKVLAFLDEGGFSAYVAASRATSRNGLCLVRPVTLGDLNKPLPSDLFFEMNRLHILEHNTSVQHGYSDGPLKPVPDHEAETTTTCSELSLKIEYSDLRCSNAGSNIPKSSKRKLSATDFSQDVKVTLNACANNTASMASSANKKHCQRQDEVDIRRADHRAVFPHLVLHGGCQWSAENWSCAYNSVYMSLFLCVAQMSSLSREAFGKMSVLAAKLLLEFESVRRSPLCENFNASRDRIRDFLSAERPSLFPRTGPIGIAASLIIDLVMPPRGLPGLPFYLISSYDSPASLDDYLSSWTPSARISRIPLHRRSLREHTTTSGDPSSSQSTNATQPQSSICSQSSFHNIFDTDSYPSTSQSTEMTPLASPMPSQSAPNHGCYPIIVFELHPEDHYVYPSRLISIPCTSGRCQYRLASIVYHGDFHFCSRFFLKDQAIWKHDGQVNGGIPVLERLTCNSSEMESTDFLSQVMVLETKQAHLYLYIRIDDRSERWLA